MTTLRDEESGTMGSVKFLCSYGGRIMPRLTDGELRYVGGHTRVLSVDRSIFFAELMVKLGELCGSSVLLRCQLPDGDLETLIFVTCDEDLRHLMSEYDRASSNPHGHMKIRAVLSPPRSLKSISPPPSPLGYGRRPVFQLNGGYRHRHSRSQSPTTYFVPPNQRGATAIN